MVLFNLNALKGIINDTGNYAPDTNTGCITGNKSSSMWGCELIETKDVDLKSGAAPMIEGSDKRALKTKNGGYADNKFGHLHYDDCKPSDLVNYKGMQIHKKTAQAFEKMQKAAQADGVNIYIVSGFRSTQRQVRTFAKKFPQGNIKNATRQQILDRARWSAPPGYSEHHTGLAIDINCTEVSFEATKAYKWLKEHAEEYGFKQSFVKNNQQGVGFEPWHWRYEGDSEAKEIFKTANSLE